MANLSSYISTNTPASLNDLSDLSTSGASTGEVLSVNSDGTFSFIAIGGGTTSYNTIGDLPLVDNDTGDTAFVTANNKLYVWNGSGWYAIATVNETPTWDSGSSPESTYTVPNDGSSLTITLAASDPEGFPITYTAITDSEFDAFADITQNSDDSFTVTKISSATQSATGTVTFRASDGVNILSNVSSFTLTIVSQIEDSNYTSLLLTSVGSNGGTNSTVTDGSTNSHSITVNGNASAQTFSPYRSGGYSYYFDGNGDYLTMANSSTFAFGTGDFTIDFWIYSTGADNVFICDWRDGGGGGGGLHLTTGGYDGSLSGGIRLSGDAGALTTTTAVDDSQWHHVAVVRSSGTTTIYIDGESNVSQSDTTNYTKESLVFCKNSYGSSGYLNAYLSDFRIVKGTAVYTSNFTPPTERLEAVANTSLLTCHLPYFKDGSTNNHTITISGNVSAKPFAPYDYSEYDTATHGGCLKVGDTTSDIVTLSPGSSTTFGTEDFTVELWVYRRSIPADSFKDSIISNRTSAGNNPAGTIALVIENDGNDQFGFQYNVSGTLYNLNGGKCDLNNWYHIAAVRNGSTLTLYVNGKSVATTSTTASIGGVTQDLAIGGMANGDVRTPCYVSDLRIVKGTAVYTSNFTPPTEPLTAITNTSLLISGTDASIVDKSQSANLTLVDSTQSSTSQTKYASSSIYFDGSDRIDLPNPSIPALSGDFTFEAWIYPTAVNYGAIFARGFAYGGGLLIWIQTNFNARFYRDDGVQLNIQSGSSISANQWTHIAVTRQGSNVKTFINGTVDQTAIMDPANYGLGNTSKFEIGAFNDNQQYFNGYMEDVRITNGLARYTANFTPPSASLEA
jgi:hypothetical protein